MSLTSTAPSAAGLGPLEPGPVSHGLVNNTRPSLGKKFRKKTGGGGVGYDGRPMFFVSCEFNRQLTFCTGFPYWWVAWRSGYANGWIETDGNTEETKGPYFELGLGINRNKVGDWSGKGQQPMESRDVVAKKWIR